MAAIVTKQVYQFMVGLLHNHYLTGLWSRDLGLGLETVSRPKNCGLGLGLGLGPCGLGLGLGLVTCGLGLGLGLGRSVLVS